MSNYHGDEGEQVRSVYRALLGREPDDAAFEKAERLSAGQATLEDILREVLSSGEYEGRVRQPQTRHPPWEKTPFLNDQTQFGELEILIRLWINDLARHRIVVDVGARGRERSNSYDLLRTFGWRGILFEANPALISSIHEAFSGLDYELVTCAVSNHPGVALFHLGANDDVSSLNHSAAVGWGPIADTIVVDVQRLGQALQRRGIPADFDLLSIDIEGEDIKVLNDLIDETDYRPGWVVIEASYDFATKSLYDLPLSKSVQNSYAMVGQTAANLILQRV